MYIAILGRQPKLGIAELERVFGGRAVTPLSAQTVCVDSTDLDIQRLGGVLKAGQIIAELPRSDWHQISQEIVRYYSNKWSSFAGKITLGISVYNSNISAREVQKTGIILKQKLKKSGVSLRLVPNLEPALSTAVSHHNKLGLSTNKVELLIVHTNDGKTIIAESTGAQNITAYANRDQQRPKRDAFVGMLPPKLAQIMINLAIGAYNKELGSASMALRVLDPFCGTGVILQEAVLMGYSAYGTDLSEKMIDYSRVNLDWLATNYPRVCSRPHLPTQNHSIPAKISSPLVDVTTVTSPPVEPILTRNGAILVGERGCEQTHAKFDYKLDVGDAMTTKWQPPIDAVVGETYLGQPFSAPPSPAKLEEVKNNCNHIITEFLKNLAPQIKSGTPICIAVPAWRDTSGHFTHLPLIATIARLGYKPHEFTNISQNDLLYYRENQIVARELLVLTRSTFP